MHYSFKIKILDLNHNQSIFEQDITDVEAAKIVGGKSSGSVISSLSASLNKSLKPLGIKDINCSDIEPLPDPPCPPCHIQKTQILL
ncbi:MAG: hypothetical protein KME32_16450 [Mojavia pulchra JT2-VF2]|jgi:tartrate dehydratase alpha subunit/fumarate hydratase class I-like protein|uniref:Uncharacterized protein n=1 Tax=Mojavia pulchra JT2-VF2 TaxID=287848 RepID=A0A951Q016_9NOST|nr:hypothetical protein [Mojavia pulchra JT2-VF2]